MEENNMLIGTRRTSEGVLWVEELIEDRFDHVAGSSDVPLNNFGRGTWATRTGLVQAKPDAGVLIASTIMCATLPKT